MHRSQLLKIMNYNGTSGYLYLQGDCQFGWDLLGYFKMDRTFYSLFIAVRPFLFRGETELEWRRGLRGDSRMCDPFCNNPAIPIQTDSHLGYPLSPLPVQTSYVRAPQEPKCLNC